MVRATQPGSARSEETVDLREYFQVLRRRFVLIVLVISVMVSLAAAYSLTRTPEYTAKATLLLQPPANVQYRPDQLVSVDTEARIVDSVAVAQLVNDELANPVRPNDLLKHVEVKATPEILIIDILYTAFDPVRAAEGANLFADKYIVFNTDRAAAAAAAETASAQAKIESLEDLRDDLDARLKEADPTSSEYDDLQGQRDDVSTQLAVWTAQLAQITPSATSPVVIGPAAPPPAPSSPNLMLNLAMGLFMGAFLGVVLAFIRERMDDRIREREDLETALSAPVLAAIPHVAIRAEGAAALVAERQPRSPAAEAYRLLRTALMATARKEKHRIYAFASATPGEGKTMTAANTAAALAQAENRVLVMSIDLRRPALHRYFGLELGVGLSDVLLGDATVQGALVQVSPDLFVMQSGTTPARPSELLEGQQMRDVLEELSQYFDYVLIDTPPVLGLADTLAVAPLTDGVVVVARADASKSSSVGHLVDALQQVGAFVLGGVLNDVPFKRRDLERYGYSGASAAVREDAPTESVRRPAVARETRPLGSVDDDAPVEVTTARGSAGPDR